MFHLRNIHLELFCSLVANTVELNTRSNEVGHIWTWTFATWKRKHRLSGLPYELQLCKLFFCKYLNTFFLVTILISKLCINSRGKRKYEKLCSSVFERFYNYHSIVRSLQRTLANKASNTSDTEIRMYICTQSLNL